MTRFSILPYWRPGSITNRINRSWPFANAVNKTAWRYEHLSCGHMRSLPIVGPRQVELERPLVKDQTVVWAGEGTGALYLVESAVNRLMADAPTGIDVVQATMVGYKRKPRGDTPLPALFELRLTELAPLDRIASGYETTSVPCATCGHAAHRKVADGVFLESDPGTDFVAPIELPNRFLVSERIKRLIQAERWWPCYLFAAADIPFSSDLSQVDSRLSDVRRLLRQGVSKEDAISQVSKAFSLPPPWIDQIRREI